MAILKKIAELRDSLNVEKTGYDERSEFYFFRASDVANAIRKGMAEHGIVHRTEVNEWTEDNKWDQNGRNRPRHTVKATVTFVDIDDGSEFSTQVIATGSDTGSDRGPRKAMTQVFKEAVIDVFIVTDEMEKFDSDSYPEQEPISTIPAEDPSAGLNDLTAKVGEMIRDESPVDGPMVNAVGTRLAAELGVSADQKEWKRDVRVMAALVKALENGEAE